MLNSPEVYFDAGFKAGEAVNQNDWSRAKFQKDWLTRALALETKQDADKARALYSKGYARARNF